MKPLSDAQSLGIEFVLSEIQFFLTCVIMMLLAAGGNIINDYFDQKVDRINKPDRVIVGKTVKRRVAMMLNHAMNISAVAIGLYISWITKLWAGVLTPVLMATLLWWYSPILKKRPFIGNLAVALCVAAVPLWTGYFEIILIQKRYGDMLTNPESYFSLLWLAVGAYALFAFLLTLAREAQKDVEDLEGDVEGGYRTLPVIFGKRFTKNYVVAILVLVMVLVGTFVYRMFATDPNQLIILLLAAIMMLLPISITVAKTTSAQTKKQFHTAGNWSKISMAGGILFTLVIRFIVF